MSCLLPLNLKFNQKIDHSVFLKNEIHCLANAIWFEARGESPEGMQAVAEVINNRVVAKGFPKTICKVVTSNRQFSYLNGSKHKIRIDISRFEQSRDILVQRKALLTKEIATKILDGSYQRQVPYDTLYFHTKDVSPAWSKKFKRVKTIGGHHFYKGNK